MNTTCGARRRYHDLDDKFQHQGARVGSECRRLDPVQPFEEYERADHRQNRHAGQPAPRELPEREQHVKEHLAIQFPSLAYDRLEIVQPRIRVRNEEHRFEIGGIAGDCAPLATIAGGNNDAQARFIPSRIYLTSLWMEIGVASATKGAPIAQKLNFQKSPVAAPTHQIDASR